MGSPLAHGKIPTPSLYFPRDKDILSGPQNYVSSGAQSIAARTPLSHPTHSVTRPLMTHLLTRFSLHAAQWNSYVPIAMIMIWIAVLACVISSVMAQPFQRQQRIFWMAMVILLPGVGVLAYLPFAFKKEDLPLMFQRKSRRSRGKGRKQSAEEPEHE